MNYPFSSFNHMITPNQFLERTEVFAYTSPMQFLVVQHTVCVCVKQLKYLSYPPLILLDFVRAEQSDAKRSELLIVERFFSINVKSGQYLYRKRPRIVILWKRHMYVHYVALNVTVTLSRRHDDRTTIAPMLINCYLSHLSHSHSGVCSDFHPSASWPI